MDHDIAATRVAHLRPDWTDNADRIVVRRALAVQNLRDGRHVVYDAAVNTRLQREQLEKLATQYDVEAIGLWIQVPTELAKNRAGTLREVGLGPVGRIIPPHIFDQYVAAFETPYSDEHTAIVAGDACFALQYRQLLRQLPSARLPKLI